MTEKHNPLLIKAVKTASANWKAAFNAGNAAGCAKQYEKTAIMHARPFGTFTATTEIQGFWQNLIDKGFSDVEYLNPKIEVVSESTAILTSVWKMNNASGVIHKEVWVLQNDGTAKLREDDFETKN